MKFGEINEETRKIFKDIFEFKYIKTPKVNFVLGETAIIELKKIFIRELENYGKKSVKK